MAIKKWVTLQTENSAVRHYCFKPLKKTLTCSIDVSTFMRYRAGLWGVCRPEIRAYWSSHRWSTRRFPLICAIPSDLAKMDDNLLLAINTTTTWWLNENDSTSQDVNQSILASTADPAFVRFRDESRFWVQRVSLFSRIYTAAMNFLFWFCFSSNFAI